MVSAAPLWAWAYSQLPMRMPIGAWASRPRPVEKAYFSPAIILITLYAGRGRDAYAPSGIRIPPLQIDNTLFLCVFVFNFNDLFQTQRHVRRINYETRCLGSLNIIEAKRHLYGERKPNGNVTTGFGCNILKRLPLRFCFVWNRPSWLCKLWLSVWTVLSNLYPRFWKGMRIYHLILSKLEDALGMNLLNKSI